MTDRSQAEVLGIVLLIGLVSVSALGLMLVAGDVLSDAQDRSEQERVEQSFVQLSHEMSTAASNGEMAREIELDAGDSGAITKTDAGYITIIGENNTAVANLSIGAIEYRHDDGSIVAYQGGGVWAEQGNETRMLSAPRINYDSATETLTLPITTVSEDKELSSGPISIGLNNTDPMRNVSSIENETVEMRIVSPYYRGWERYFRSQSGDGVIRNVDHTNQSIRVKFGAVSFEDGLSRGATYTLPPGGNHHDQIEDEGAFGTMRPMDDLIDQLVSDANDGSLNATDKGTLSTNTTFTAGTYLVDSIEGGSYNFDLTGGNITMIVDGNIDSNGTEEFINVTGFTSNHQLRIYTTGHLDIQNEGNICVDPCSSAGNASRIQIYGTSETTVNTNTGTPRIEGVIYVASDKTSWEYPDRQGGSVCPPEDYQVAFQANMDYDGSLIAASICGHSSGYDFDYDSSLSSVNIDPYPTGYEPPPRITYLNIAIHEMDVENQ